MTMPTRTCSSFSSCSRVRSAVLVVLAAAVLGSSADAAALRAVAAEEPGDERPAPRGLLPAACVMAEFPGERLDPLDFAADGADAVVAEGPEESDLPDDLEWLFDFNVTLPDGTPFDEYTTDMHRKLGVSISGVEALNARYIQSERLSRGIPGLGWSADLIVQAQNWARYLARIQQLVHRGNLAQGVSNPWRMLSENIGENARVSRDGMHRAFMNSAGHRQNILDSRPNRLGLGIARGGNFYWVVHIFKQAV